MPKFTVKWSWTMYRTVEADSAKEAIEISEDMGDTNPDAHTRTAMRIERRRP